MSSWASKRRHFTDKTRTISVKETVPTLANFTGTQYRLADNWFSIIPLDAFNTKPIRYLEIGTFYGANLLSVANSYASHPDSTLTCIDPWQDYADYPEYKGQQDTIYETFLTNIAESGKENITVRRGYSHEVIPTLADDSFDIIYIDGNHEPEYVLEDAVLSFRKLKTGGVMIFDDYGWGGPDLTQKGIDGFLAGYHKHITRIGLKESQLFVQKQ
jgi:predicted O-methyltransferase YrrM